MLCLCWRPWHASTGGVAFGGGWSQLAICPLVGWMPGSWTQHWARFSWGPLQHLGRGWSLRLKTSMIGCRRAVPFFICTLAFALQLREGTENLSQGSRAALGTTRCVGLAALSVHLPLTHSFYTTHRYQSLFTSLSLFSSYIVKLSLSLSLSVYSQNDFQFYRKSYHYSNVRLKFYRV
jgi:hypothetical protein